MSVQWEWRVQHSHATGYRYHYLWRITDFAGEPVHLISEKPNGEIDTWCGPSAPAFRSVDEAKAWVLAIARLNE